MLYPTNRREQSKTVKIFFTHQIGKSEKNVECIFLECIGKIVGKLKHWINQYSHFKFQVKTFLTWAVSISKRNTWVYQESCIFKEVFVSSHRTSRLSGHLFYLLYSQSLKGLYLASFFFFFAPHPSSSYSSLCVHLQNPKLEKATVLPPFCLKILMFWIMSSDYVTTSLYDCYQLLTLRSFLLISLIFAPGSCPSLQYHSVLILKLE